MKKTVLTCTLAITFLCGLCACHSPKQATPNAGSMPIPSRASLTPESTAGIIPTVGTTPTNRIPPTAVSPARSTPTPIPLPTPRSHEESYTVQAGDTLNNIALQYQLSVAELQAANQLSNPDWLFIGQSLLIPVPMISEMAPDFWILPDAELPYGPSSIGFDAAALIASSQGPLSRYSETDTEGQTLRGDQIVHKVARENSVNARLLLALLEYEAHWLRPGKEVPPDLSGTLYTYLSHSANQLLYAEGLFRRGQLGIWTLADNSRFQIPEGLNPATAALQYYFSLRLGRVAWLEAVSENGFQKLYRELFGDPFAFEQAYLPADLQIPELALPFASGDLWYFTGGPHFGWGSGSAWAALDFAPSSGEDLPTEACYQSQVPVLAAIDGLVVYSDDGSVVIDLDKDGFEQSGWTLLYLHIAKDGRVPVGTLVATGDVIGVPSCEGGYSTATHFHLARRYNGIWIEADGPLPFVMDGWRAHSFGTVYDGYLEKNGIRIEAYNGRSKINEIYK